MKKAIVIIIILAATRVHAQDWRDRTHVGIGLTYGSLTSKESTAGGFSMYVGHNFIETKNAAFSLSTNLKIGATDKTGFAFPVLVILAFIAPDASSINTPNNVNTFADLPLTLHYNFGLGANNETNKRFGFYFGGGFNYMFTGFTDTSGTSQSISFWGRTFDAGIRFGRSNDTGDCADLNFSFTQPLRTNIGQIKNPQFFALTLSINIGKFGR